MFALDGLASEVARREASRENLIAQIAAERRRKDEERSELVPAAVRLIRTGNASR